MKRNALLGAKFGYNAIPKQWINQLNKKTELEAKTDKLIKIVEA